MVKEAHTSGPVRSLFDAYVAGTVDRRSFVQCATALGVGMSIIHLMASAVAAQDGSPQASPAIVSDIFTDAGGKRPAFGTENQERGAGGDARIIQYQSPPDTRITMRPGLSLSP